MHAGVAMRQGKQKMSHASNVSLDSQNAGPDVMHVGSDKSIIQVVH